MKTKLTLISFFLSLHFCFSQTEKYDLESQNLHRKVRKTIEHYYKYDKESGGFVKTSVNIKRYNDDENLAETYSLYNSKFSESNPVKKLYSYNADGLIVSTKDISDYKDKYSTELKFTYDNKGNLLKRESVYTDGSKYYTNYTNDSRGRIINKKEYNKESKLTADVNYNYNGNKTTEIRTSFSATDGSIVGTYTTTFENGRTTLYNSEGKYGTSSTTYEYDKNNNISSTHYKGKTNSKTTYDYVYDKKDNWVKKHYRSGKYQYFYFREIHFDNGDVTGSTDFDAQFVNGLGNFENVAVVPLKKKETKTTTKTTTNSAILRNKTWDFDYVYLKSAVKKLKGTIKLNINGSDVLQKNTSATLTVNFSGSTFTFNFTVNDTETVNDKYRWMLSNNNSQTCSIGIYKQTKLLKDDPLGVTFNANGLLSIKENNGDTMVFYLK